LCRTAFDAEYPATFDTGGNKKMKIGIAGTGRMGLAMGQRLVDEGFDLVVWNRTAEKTKSLAEAGAATVESPAALVKSVEAIITCLTNAEAIDKMYRGMDGLLSGDVKGKLFIEMSTVRPETEEKLAADIRAKGGAMIECPVGGSTVPARDGKLIGFVGGDDKDVARAMPVLKALCRRIEHVGPTGAGASFKLAINLPLSIYWQALGEALSLCHQHGVDPARVADIFSDTSGGPNVLKVRGGAVASAMKGERVTGGFDIDSVRKDMRTMLEEGKARGVELPLIAQALACYDEASEAGYGACDPANETAYWALRGSGKA
jgi:3-hydroxyisobutyrate dehydrogenase